LLFFVIPLSPFFNSFSSDSSPLFLLHLGVFKEFFPDKYIILPHIVLKPSKNNANTYTTNDTKNNLQIAFFESRREWETKIRTKNDIFDKGLDDTII
jgi:hypothetical protein